MHQSIRQLINDEINRIHQSVETVLTNQSIEQSNNQSNNRKYINQSINSSEACIGRLYILILWMI